MADHKVSPLSECLRVEAALSNRVGQHDRLMLLASWADELEASAARCATLADEWDQEAEKLRKCGGRAQRRGDLADADVAFTAAQDAKAFADQLRAAAPKLAGKEP